MVKWIVDTYAGIVTAAMWVWVLCGAGVGVSIGYSLDQIARMQNYNAGGGRAFFGAIIGAGAFFVLGAVLFGAGLILDDIRQAVRGLERTPGGITPNTDAGSTGLPRMAAPARMSAEERRWAALMKYDDDIARAVSEVRPLGERYVARLGAEYLALSEKTYLPHIVAAIRDEAEQDRLSDEARTKGANAMLSAKQEQRRAMLLELSNVFDCNHGFCVIAPDNYQCAYALDGTVHVLDSIDKIREKFRNFRQKVLVTDQARRRQMLESVIDELLLRT